MAWLSEFGVDFPREEIQKAWESRQVALGLGMHKDYRLFVEERRGGRTTVRLYRRGPRRPAGLAARRERRRGT